MINAKNIKIMEKRNIQIYLLLFLCAISLSSCELNDDENLMGPTYNFPLINIENGSNLELFLGQSIIFNNISLTASVGITNFRIELDGNVVRNENFDGTSGQISSSFIFDIPDEWSNSTRILNFEVTDILGQVTTSTVNVVVGTVTPQFEIEDIELGGQPFKRITGNINVDQTLDNSSLWIIADTVSVAQQIKLTITEGTQIFAETPTTVLYVRQLGQVDWQGSSTNPIVFNSLANAPGQGPGNDTRGQWEGIRIDGDGVGSNSGIIRYLRIMHAGFGNDGQNAFRLQNVGSGSTIEYVQVYRSINRGIRINSGDVGLKYMVSTSGEGTGIRMDSNWSGNGQFWIINKDIPAGNALEGRSGTPVLSNITITGQGLNNIGADPDGGGIRIRDGGNAKIYRSVVTGVGASLRYSGGSEQGIALGNSFFRDSASFDNSSNNGTGFHNSANFFNPTSGDYEAIFNNTVTPFDIENSYVGAGTLNLQDAVQLDDPFFETANYIGAVETGNDWTVGWCVNIDGTLRQ